MLALLGLAGTISGFLLHAELSLGSMELFEYKQ